MQRSRIGVVTLVAALALVPAASTQAAELVVATGEENLVVAPRGEVTAFTVDVYAEGVLGCGKHDHHEVLATIETSYSIVDGAVTEGGLPSDPYRFFRSETAQPPPRHGCPVSWTTSPEPYRVQASVAVSPETAPGDYAVVLRATLSDEDLLDNHPTTITVRVPEGEAPPPPPPPAQPGVLPPPPLDRGLPLPRENVSVNLLPVSGKVLVRYPGSTKVIVLDEAAQVPVRSKLDTTAGRVELTSDNDGKGTPQSATFWNGRFAVGYTRAVVAGVRGKRSPRRRASRPITELTLAGSCGRRGGAASSARGRLFAHADRRRKRRGLFGRGRGRFRTRGSNGAGTVRGTHWYSENRCRSTFFRVFTGVVDVRDFSEGRTVRLRRKQSYLARSQRPKRD